MNLIAHFQSASPTSTIPHKGLENTTVAEILKTKGDEEAGALFWCSTNDTVYDAVRQVLTFGSKEIFLCTYTIT